MAKRRSKNLSRADKKGPSAQPSSLTEARLPLRVGMRLLSAVAGGRCKRQSAVERAQDIMYDAWESRSKKRALALAKEALAISADCADAYNLLAEQAGSLEEKVRLYRRGVEASKRAMRREVLPEEATYLWIKIEREPYMYARAGLARCLWEMGQREEAVSHYQEMRSLEPHNLGILNVLMPWLLEMGRLKEAEQLCEQYKDAPGATCAYSRALLDFTVEGDSEKARKALEEAIESNRHVPAYLTGKKRAPRKMPPHTGFGDRNEAVAYVAHNAVCWESTPGALEWLAANAE
jgi:tetratricopeptide (TPR) repeat protein